MEIRIEPRLTVADLDACPDDNNRYELIDGELFVSRAPGIPHQRVLHNFQMELGFYLKENPVGILVPGTGTIFSDYDAVIPDLVFFRSERCADVTSEQKIISAPDLVLKYCRRDLRIAGVVFLWTGQLYAKYGVKEYWIVDSENQSVLIFHLREHALEEVATLRETDEITSALLPGSQLQACAVFDLKWTLLELPVLIGVLTTRSLLLTVLTRHYKNLVRFSRNQLIGALILLVIVWMVILFRMLS